MTLQFEEITDASLKIFMVTLIPYHTSLIN